MGYRAAQFQVIRSRSVPAGGVYAQRAAQPAKQPSSEAKRPLVAEDEAAVQRIDEAVSGSEEASDEKQFPQERS